MVRSREKVLIRTRTARNTLGSGCLGFNTGMERSTTQRDRSGKGDGSMANRITLQQLIEHF